MGTNDPTYMVDVNDVAKCDRCGDEHEGVQEYYLGDEAGMLGFPTFCVDCFKKEQEDLEDEPYELTIPGW